MFLQTVIDVLLIDQFSSSYGPNFTGENRRERRRRLDEKEIIW